MFCVGVMYSGEYDDCNVTLSVYPHLASLKNMPEHGGNRTYDLWNTSPMLCQLSYAVWSVRVCDISEQNLVPLISMLSNKIMIVLCWCNHLSTSAVRRSCRSRSSAGAPAVFPTPEPEQNFVCRSRSYVFPAPAK